MNKESVTDAAWQQALAALPLVAILRGIAPAECDAVGDALWALGYRVLEVPLNSPEPFKSIERLVRRLPGAIVGAGTVLTVPEVAATQAAGGRIVLSPNFDASVVQATLITIVRRSPGHVHQAEPVLGGVDVIVNIATAGTLLRAMWVV